MVLSAELRRSPARRASFNKLGRGFEAATDVAASPEGYYCLQTGLFIATVCGQCIVLFAALLEATVR